MTGKMILRPLELTDEVKQRIAELRDRAEAEPLSQETMMERAQLYRCGQELPPLTQFEMHIEKGWTVQYMVEDHGIAVMRRLRVAIDAPDKSPSLEGVKILMEEFGFLNGIQAVIHYVETVEDGVIWRNVQEPVDGNMESLVFAASR